MSFTNKVVLITGAGSGMGAEIALHFAKLNAKLCLIDINDDNLTKVCKKITKTAVLKVEADLSKDEGVKKSIESALKAYNKIDVLINCVGVHGPGNIKDANIIEEYDRIMSVNLRSVVAMTSLATPALIQSKGCVINISSVAANLATVGVLPYNLSKSGVNHFTKSAALELASDGVRVNCISPGPVKTNILLNFGVTDSENEAFWETTRQLTPLKRLVKVEHIAEMAVFLASDKADSITGAEILVDCGYQLHGTGFIPGISKN